eukprot:286859-Chlamydomonas_euryale.AAC.1
MQATPVHPPGRQQHANKSRPPTELADSYPAAPRHFLLYTVVGTRTSRHSSRERAVNCAVRTPRSAAAP